MFGFTKRPLFLIAWKNLKTYPVRIFLTTSSIILGVAVIIASNIFSESNKSAFDNLFSGIYEGIDLVVQPVQEDFAQGFSSLALYLFSGYGACLCSHSGVCQGCGMGAAFLRSKENPRRKNSRN